MARDRLCCPGKVGDPHDPTCKNYKQPATEVPKDQRTPAQKARAKAANASADKQVDETMDEPVTAKDDMPDEREEWFRAPGLQRMKMDLSPDERRVVERMHAQIDERIFSLFLDAFHVMNEIYNEVREPEVNQATGEITLDPFGNPVWRRDPVTGVYFEDWSRLGTKQRENFIFEIVTKTFDWEQKRDTLWTEAMFSKAIFTERFAIEYDAPMAGTIDDRNAVANEKAAEDRYFALMQASVSRKADSIVRTMNSIMMRLKETLIS